MTDIFDEEPEDSEDDETPEDFDEVREDDPVQDSAEFTEKYGFEHNCRCADDWDQGNLGVVAVCYLNMCRDALENLAKTREINNEKEAELASLRIQLVDQE